MWLLTVSKKAFAGASHDILEIVNVNKVPLTSKPLSITSSKSIVNGFRYSSIELDFWNPWKIPMGMTLFDNSLKLIIKINIF